MKLEQEKTQKEADIKIRNGEVVSLQKELDALNHSVKQLEMQKFEAQKRLDELDDKVAFTKYFWRCINCCNKCTLHKIWCVVNSGK